MVKMRADHVGEGGGGVVVEGQVEGARRMCKCADVVCGLGGGGRWWWDGGGGGWQWTSGWNRA